MRLSYIIFLFFLLLLISCDNKSNELPQDSNKESKSLVSKVQSEPTRQKDVSQDNMDFQFNIDTVANNQRKLQYQPVDLLNHDQLIASLPKSIPGFKKYGNRTFLNQEYGRNITSVSTEYVAPKGGLLNIQITDYGENAPIKDTIFYENLPEISGFQASKISLKNGKGYLLYDEIRKEMKINAFFYHRFIVQIDGSYITSNTKFDSFLKYVDTESLYKQTQKIKN